MAMIINTSSLNQVSGSASADPGFKQFKDQMITKLNNASISNGAELANALLDKIENLAEDDIASFEYNEDNLNIITTENSDTNFNYDNGNLIINYQ